MKLSKTRTCGDASYIIGKESFLFFINWYTIEKVMSRFVRTWTFFLCLNEIHTKAFSKTYSSSSTKLPRYCDGESPYFSLKRF